MSKPEKRPLRLTFPKLPPYETVGHYFHSKKFLKTQTVARSTWDNPGRDPIFQLVAAERVLQAVEDELRKKKEWLKGQFEILKLQWDHIRDSEEEFKQNFISSVPFIKSNEVKRRRAINKIKEDAKLTERRTKEVEDLQKQCNSVIELKSNMEASIAKLQTYEKFMNNVIAASKDFHHPQDVIARYESLVATKTVLGKRQEEYLADLENAKSKFTRMIEENRLTILGLTNIVANLNSKYNTVSRRAFQWENVVLGIRRRSHLKYVEIAEVKDSCWNLYRLMSKRKGDALKISENNFEDQLSYIKKTLQELRIVKELSKMRDVGVLKVPLVKRRNQLYRN